MERKLKLASRDANLCAVRVFCMARRCVLLPAKLQTCEACCGLGSEGRKEGVKPLDHGQMGEHRITERGRRHLRHHYCLRGSNHLTRLGRQDGASEDPLSGFFDRDLKKTIHLTDGPCPRHGQWSDRDLENSNLQSSGNSFLLPQADMP
jgi:hypothetical protein